MIRRTDHLPMVFALLATTGWTQASSQRTLDTVPAGQKLQPLLIAPVRVDAEGRVQLAGPWTDLSEQPAGPGRCHGFATAFDAFEPDENGAPKDGDCQLGGNRWFFGDTYCNTFAVNDMTVALGREGKSAIRTEFAWYWTVNGPGTSERCQVVVFTAEDFDPFCQGPPFAHAYQGVAFDFGVLESSSTTRQYYYADSCLADYGLSLQNPLDGQGAYAIQLYTNLDRGQFATCAQPMLWGTQFNRAGTQGPVQWDDDSPRDGFHTPGVECHDYAYNLCPDPLGAMFCLYSEAGQCTGVERLKGRCREKNGRFTLKATLIGAVPGEPAILQYDDDHDQPVIVNARGKAVAKWSGVEPGEHPVQAELPCDTTLTTDVVCGQDVDKDRCRYKILCFFPDESKCEVGSCPEVGSFVCYKGIACDVRGDCDRSGTRSYLHAKIPCVGQGAKGFCTAQLRYEACEPCKEGDVQFDSKPEVKGTHCTVQP